MHTTKICGVTAFAVAVLLSTFSPASARGNDEVPLTLTGCVIPGAAVDSFLVMNVTVSGTTAAPANAHYRLNSTRKLRGAAWHWVQITGEADLADHDKARVKVEAKKDGKIESQITSERKTVKVVNTPVWGEMPLKADVDSYGFDVKAVKRLEDRCSYASDAMLAMLK